MRQTTEAWYDDTSDTTANLTYSTTYDAASRVASVSDGSTTLSYEYSIFGNLTSQTQSLNGLADDVVFDYQYDAAGRKTSVASKIGTTNDYINEYDYDALGRIVKVTQEGLTVGNTVAEKRVDFAYSDDGTSSTVTRYADLAGTKHVAATDQAFDHLGRVSDITHRQADEVFANYDYTWDKAGRITAIDMDFSAGTTGTEYDDTATYAYDNTSQLTDADYVSQTDEDYSYDETGNRTMTGYTTGDQNRMTTDAAGYTYLYDSEGNRTAKFVDTDSSGTLNTGDTDITQYTWDHRNRLIEVITYDTFGGQPTADVEYGYDAYNRLVSRVVDATTTTVYVHDGMQIVLDFEDGSLDHRYVWGTGADQILAQENVDDGAADTVLWPLADHLGTVRDVLRHDGDTTVDLENHYVYAAFGSLVTRTSTLDVAQSTFGCTGKMLDIITGLQNNWQRWYDPETGRWITVDPIAFEAGDVNLYRYVGNGVTLSSDPLGLWRIDRRGGGKAIARSQKDDTINDLAQLLGFNASDHGRWITWSGTREIVGQGELSVKKIQRNDPWCPGQYVLVPNTIVSGWFGDAGSMGKFWSAWTTNNRDLARLGFAVKVHDNDSYSSGTDSKSDFLALLERTSKQRTLHGLYLMGHGGGAGAGSDGWCWGVCAGPITRIAFWEMKKQIVDRYRLAAVILHLCQGDPEGKQLVSASANRVWEAKAKTHWPGPWDEIAGLWGFSATPLSFDATTFTYGGKQGTNTFDEIFVVPHIGPM